MRNFLLIFSLIFAFSASALAQAETDATQTPDPVAVMPPQDMVPDSLVMWADGPKHSRFAIVADKSQRTLSIWGKKNEQPYFVEAHPMDMGKKEGDKKYRGDHKTPEGIYFAISMKDGPGLNFDEYGVRAFVLDYPNFFDKRARKTGDGIWLHAIPDTKSLMRGSRGCVVVRNEIIERITPMIDVNKTPVIILDKVNYISKDELQKRTQAMKTWLEDWRTAWASKDIDRYMEFYGEDFKALRMNKKTWRRYKTSLNERNESILVNAINPSGFSNGEEAVVTFLQEYESDTVKDFGVKTLFLRREGDSYKISGEEWRAASPELLAQVPKQQNQ